MKRQSISFITNKILESSNIDFIADQILDDYFIKIAVKDLPDSFFADIIVALFSADIYGRYLEEKTGREDVTDAQILRIIRIVRTVKSNFETLVVEKLNPILPQGLENQLKRALAKPPTYQNVMFVTQALRTIFRRIPSSKIRTAFTVPREYQIVNKAADASMNEDELEAMKVINSLPIRTSVLKTLVKRMARNVTGDSTVSLDDTIKATQIDSEKLTDVKRKKDVTPADTEEYKNLTKQEEKITEQIKSTTVEEKEPATKADVIEIATKVVAETKETKAFGKMEIPPDPEQQAAILTTGKVLVSAGAGAGKTKTLSSKVAYLVKDKNVAPSSIFVTTFTNAAATEMRERIEKLIGEASKDIFIGTFHSFSLKTLKQFASPQYQRAIMNSQERGFKVGYLMNLAVEEYEEQYGKCPLSSKEAQLLVGKFKYMRVTPDKAEVYAKEQAINDPKNMEKLEAAAKLYAMFETLKGRNMLEGKPPYYSDDMASRKWAGRKQAVKKVPVIDFDDMQNDFLTMLEKDPNLKNYLQKKYKHFIMDECQDSNNIQLSLFELMTDKVDETGDAWMVGDSSQSIYGFRGAFPEKFIKLADDPKWKVRKIKTNYRSAPEIVQAANKLIEHNVKRIPMEAVPNRKEKASIELKRNVPHELANSSMDYVKNILNSDIGEDPSKFAVLARTNSELHDFEASCIIRGIPYTRKGGQNFFNRKEVKAVVDYITLATSNNIKEQNEAILSVCDYPNRFLGRKFKNLLESDKSRRPYLELIGDSDFLYSMERQAKYVEKFYDDIERLRAMSKTGTTDELIYEILELEGPKGKIKDFLVKDAKDEDSESGSNEDEAKSMGGISYLLQMIEPDPTQPLVDPNKPEMFLKKVDEMKELAKKLKSEKGVVLSTIHGAKGLQWKHVFAVMQNPRTDTTEDQLEEERRMAYVQITRAEDDLTVLSPTRDARGRPAGISQFTQEADLVKYMPEQEKKMEAGKKENFIKTAADKIILAIKDLN